MARTLYKTIAAVLFVLVTIQYFYFYPLKNGGGSVPSPATGGSSLSSFSGISSPAISSDSLASPHASPIAWRQPNENSVFYIHRLFTPPTPPDQEFSTGTSPTDSLQVPQQQLINLLNQVNFRLNQSLSPHTLSTRLNPVSFISTDKSNNSSEVGSNGTITLVSNITKISENQSIITIVPLNQANMTTTAASTSSLNLTLCPIVSPYLLGFVRVRLQAPSLADIGRNNNDLDLGGHYRPPTCRARSRVAIIVPFRDREDHLRLFLHNLIPMLKRQQIEFNVFVIEQGGSSKNEAFNRAMLFNVGFVEANKRYPNWECFIFHDVDLIPENDYNLYDCPVQPRHMSVAVDKMKYKLPYKTIFGGISALTKEHFTKVNGFSNMFWGWGAEDDDMAGRIAFHGLFISRPSPSVARYKMLKHRQQKLNTQRYKILQKGKHRFNSDGLSNLNYTVEQIILEKTHTLNGKAKVGGSFSKKKKWKNAKRTRYRNGRRYLS